MHMKFSTLALFMATALAGLRVQASLTAVDLRCDYAVNPLGVDSAHPRLFWKLKSDERGQKQTACEILVASSPEKLAREQGDVWDSGRMMSAETIQVSYAGAPLFSSEQVFWKVRVWDAHGQPSAWSMPATWTMGLLAKSDWQAKWIDAVTTNLPSLLLRREWDVKPGLKRALVNVCGLGEYELTLNGKKVGDEFLTPGWTKYDKTCLYDTLDLTPQVRPGRNTIGLELGNGMYNVLGGGRFTKFKGSFGPQKAIAQIRLEYADGTVEIIGTDEKWRVSAGPITFSSIYGGEDCDERLVQKGWNENGFDDSSWAAAQVVDGPGGALRGIECAAPPIHEFEIHRPVAMTQLTNGDTVYDLGQNAAHVPHLVVDGPAGSRVQLLPAELVDADGSIRQHSMGAGHRGAIWCEYTKATDGEESWSPKFFYVGCRYIQAHVSPATPRGALPKIKSLTGIVVNSASEPVGKFACSNPLFNRIRNLVRWAQRSNMMSLMTDCPHRERLGWLEEDHLNGPALRYEFDLAQLFTKTLNDIADSQLTNGLVPTTAPEYTVFRDKSNPDRLRNDFGDSPEWSSSFILVPWQQYEFDGDLNLFRIHYDAMKAYLAYLGSRATNNIVDFGLGDWFDLGPKRPGVSQLTPVALTATAFYYEDASIMAHVAALLGNTGDAQQFGGLAAHIRSAFNQEFYNPQTMTYATDSQCANAIALVMDICERTNRAAVVDAIVRDVRAHGNALTAGDVGYRYLLRALADGGRSDVIYEINNQSDKPGYGMQLAKGATSLTEAWDASGSNSQNHFMLGQIEEWFYHDLAGIRSDGNGFQTITIAPQVVSGVAWTRASFNSIRGKIVSRWKRDANQFALDVTIPAGTTATVYVPAQSADSVTESGHPASKSQGVTFLREENGCAVYDIESGSYGFKSQMPPANQDPK
jgi:alpha-L-rhamnosidase